MQELLLIKNSKLKNMLIHNQTLIENMSTCKNLNDPKAQRTHEIYLNLQANLKKMLPGCQIPSFTPAKAKCGVCEICGFPVSELLQVHHVIPKSRGGSNKQSNKVQLCPTCHYTLHRCAEHGISEAVRDYYSDFYEAFEGYVRMIQSS